MKKAKEEEVKKKAVIESADPEDGIPKKCKMRVCLNPESGEFQIVYGKGCPKGWIEKIAGQVHMRGLRFVAEKEEE